jgi:caffeoyl-CoA O-methyltransferase
MHDKTFEYCMAHTSPVSPVLHRLERETHLRTLSPQMSSGPYQGTLLRMISQMLQPKRILEVGTFTGYAALCLAEGLADDGILHTIEVNDELAWIIQGHVKLAGLDNKVRLHLGDAADVIPTLDEVFDLVFLDAGKLDYDLHYELCLARLRSGGIMLIDNVLWDGKVAGGDQKDETAIALRTFNNKVHEDVRVDNLLLALRDGLLVVRKK